MDAVKQFLKTLWAGVLLCALISPKSVKALRPMPHFWWLLLMQMPVAVLLQRWELFGAPQIFSRAGVLSDVFFGMLMLAGATLAASAMKRAVMAYSFASLLIAASIFLGGIWWCVLLYLPKLNALLGLKIPTIIPLALGGLHWMLVALRTAQFCFPGTLLWLRVPIVSSLALLSYAISVFGLLPLPRYVEFDQSVLYQEEAELPAPRLSFDPEQVMYKQPMMVSSALAAVLPSDPAQAEIYLLAIAGDGSINAFLNEVEYARKLFENRFLAQGKTLVLANHPHSTDRLPLANVSNVRAAIKGMRQKMGDEDALFVFLTSHGGPGPEHEFLMELGPLALNQLTPDQLRDALNAAGVQRYFGLISACYSGGYLDRLQNVNAIIMTAARADRTSFGCAPDADLTYFGRAYLLEALNKTKDFVKAFELAERSIEAREKAEELLASTPQIRIGRGAREWLNDWQRRMEPGEPVPFYPAPEAGLLSNETRGGFGNKAPSTSSSGAARDSNTDTTTPEATPH